MHTIERERERQRERENVTVVQTLQNVKVKGYLTSEAIVK